LLDVQEVERRNLARELHDSLGATLTALSINLAALKDRTAADRDARARVDDSVALVKSTALAIENMVAGLRPPMFDDHGITAALEWYGRQFSERVGVAISVQAIDTELSMPPQVGIALFRIAQEALNNVAKHAHAKRVAINLWRTDAEFVMSISDDGMGLPTGDTREWRAHGLGMVTMRERAQAVGGRIEIERLPEGGTRVSVRVRL
jgi:signal transduction histidine kinase